MRYLELPSEARIQFDADPVWADEFLGPEPELTPADAKVWALYWTTRRAMPSDAMGGEMPLDLVRALELNDRLYEVAPERRVAGLLQTMDAAYLSGRKESRERKDKAKKGG